MKSFDNYELQEKNAKQGKEREKLRRVAAMIGTDLEEVCNMAEQERNDLLQVLDLSQELRPIKRIKLGGEEEERLGRKRRADHLVEREQPSAPECPVCWFARLGPNQL